MQATHEIRQGDQIIPRSQLQLPVVVVLDRLRSAYNVGNIFRLSEALRLQKILACGYTPVPPHPQLAKTARGCDQLVECEHFPDSVSAVLALKELGYRIYGVETVSEAHYYADLSLEFPAAFLLGNEALGLSAAVLAHCDYFIQLPTLGCKNSINVGNCAAVVLYEAWRQWRQIGRVQA